MTVHFHHYLHFARALKSRPYAMIWIGRTVSGLGDGIFYIALAWQVLLMTHSGATMGMVLVASTIPRLVFMLFGGVMADRLPRRVIILWSDGVRGLIVLGISILGFTGQLRFWHLIIEAFIFGIVDGFFTPAISAIMPDLVEKEDLPSANALNAVSNNLAQLAGPVIGASLVTLFNPTSVFALNALSFFLSAAFLLSVQIPEHHMQGAPLEEKEIHTVLITNGQNGMEENRGGRSEASKCKQKKHPQCGFGGVIADMREGFFYVRSSRWLWVSICCLSLGNLGLTGPLEVAMPKLIHDAYGQGAWLLGLINSAVPVGSLLALVLVSRARRVKKRGVFLYLSLLPAGAGIVIFGLPWTPSLFFIAGLVASAMFGFSLAYFNITWYTILQELIPRDKLGRVVSLDAFGSFALIPVSEALAGVLTDWLGPALVFLLGGSLGLVMNVLPLLVRDVREMK